MDAVTIRRATAADARAIAEVHVASWRWAYRGQLPDDLLDGLSVDEREAGWRSALEEDDAGVRVAVREEAIVGFASGMASRDDDAPADTGEVLTLYVVQDEVGKGTGRELLAAVQEDLRRRGFTRARLWVLETNTRARAFYERRGWTWDGTRGEHQVACANRPIVRYVTDL